MRAMRTITYVILFLLMPVALNAQDSDTEEIEEIRRYTVELIIFKYAQDVASGNEIFPGDKPSLDAPFPDDEPIIDFQPPVEEEPRVIRDIEFVLLGRDEYTMGEVMGRLQRLEAYKPLMHVGWTQITWPQEETRAIDLASIARPPRGLDGQLTLYLNRFLHLVVDLELDAPGGAPQSNRTSTYGDFVESGPVRYRINENRILRTSELRYFDHPKFGVLAKVTRVDDDEEEQPDPLEEELLGYPPE